MRHSRTNGQRHATLYSNPVCRRDEDAPSYPSAAIGAFDPAAQARHTNQSYTGSLVIGIATMHKSNLVPVTEAIQTNPKITG
jgi:hypothetical protein